MIATLDCGCRVLTYTIMAARKANTIHSIECYHRDGERVHVDYSLPATARQSLILVIGDSCHTDASTIVSSLISLTNSLTASTGQDATSSYHWNPMPRQNQAVSGVRWSIPTHRCHGASKTGTRILDERETYKAIVTGR
jgi:hypothetical protein